MDPYEADPNKLPANDLYVDWPLLGRYHPVKEDFQADARYINSEYCGSSDPKLLAYWESVLDKCTPAIHLMPSSDGRDIFALGRVIVKSGHLQPPLAWKNYGLCDANEVAAHHLAPDTVPKPQILFAGKLRGGTLDVLVQERVPGVALHVAWHYLSPEQKAAFKRQARDVLRTLRAVRAPGEVRAPAYLVPDLDPVANRACQDEEPGLLGLNAQQQEENEDEKGGKGAAENDDDPLCLMHNDLNQSNIIVKADRIVGVVDWEHAGWFRFSAAAAVHSQVRIASREWYKYANLTEEQLADAVYWNNLYELERE